RQQFTTRKVAFRAENDQVTGLGCLRYRHVILLKLTNPVLKPGYTCNFLTVHCTAFTSLRKL
ncbi:hypothetical protein QP121_14555, partial [Bifidobacterium scardovii]|nr:hypothetical protein [Bifidobacterium scardovii]